MPTCTVIHPSAAYRHGVRSALDSSGYDVVEPQPTTAEIDVALLFVDEQLQWRRFEEAVGDETVVVALLPDLAPEGFRRALAMGADGVCDANLPPEMIARVVDAAVAGEVTLPAAMARQLIGGAAVPAEPVALTEEERDLLQLHADGATLGELARQRFLGERTVRRRLQNICVKLEVRNRAEAIKRATQLGLID